MAAQTGSAGSYDTDEQGFLKDWTRWDREFPERMASSSGISGGLTPDHWRVLTYIRDEFERTGECASVYATCKATGLSRRDLRALFPTGYLRGACKLAGITYHDRFVEFPDESAWAAGGAEGGAEASSSGAAPSSGAASSGAASLGDAPSGDASSSGDAKGVDEFGFLLDPADWDEEYARRTAKDMKVPGGLGDAHMRVIHYLRDRYAETGAVPTVIECCEGCSLELEDLERLFPDGYQRGAVKLAGLRVR